jgi:hypothetical protein
MASRAALPDWPRLMGDDLAAQYLQISATTLRALNITPRHIGRRVLWDRHDLDRYIDRLADQPMSAEDEEAESAEVERRFLEKRRRRG